MLYIWIWRGKRKISSKSDMECKCNVMKRIKFCMKII
jgi:hypothetical protein